MRLQPQRILRWFMLICIGVFVTVHLHHVTILPVVSVIEEEKILRHDITNTTLPSTPSHPAPPVIKVAESGVSSPAVCGGRFPSKQQLEAPQDWQMFLKNHFVYSAFFDLRMNPSVLRITAVLPRMAKHSPVYCYVWYPNRTEPIVQTARFAIIGEGMSYKFQAGWILCQHKDEAAEPLAVGVSNSPCDPSPVIIPVITPKPQPIPDHQFTVCICGPIKFNYSDSNQFVEWIETNSLFGAEKFVVYNHSSHDSLKPYVKYYENQNRLDFRSWSLPFEKPDIKNFGHMALLSDCMYRNMYHSKYIAFLDLDELLVPKEMKSWQEVLEAKECEQHSSVNFKNVFYKLEWDQDEIASMNETIAGLGLKSLLYTKREKKIWQHRSRSKYIVRPETIMEPGVHYPHKYLTTKTNCDISSNIAWVQHYRWWDDPRPPWVVDRTMVRYADRLVQAAHSTHAMVKGLGP